MVKLYDEFRLRGFEVLAVNLREDPTKVAQFVKRFDMRFPVLLDRGGIVSMNYFVRGIPTSVFVDEKGVIQYVHVGTMSESVMREYVVGLLE
jgi:peroxiredoxin